MDGALTLSEVQSLTQLRSRAANQQFACLTLRQQFQVASMELSGLAKELVETMMGELRASQAHAD